MCRIINVLTLILVVLNIIVVQGTDTITDNYDWDNHIDNHKDADGVTYLLFTRRNPTPELYEKGKEYKYFNRKRSTKVIIHGYNDEAESELVELLKNAFLEESDYNIIAVDWSKWSMMSYLEAVKNVPAVGRAVGTFLLRIRANLSTTTVYGFSLGSHVAGMAGHALSSKVSRIVALDAAGPCFYSAPAKYRLESSDAELVEMLHTDGGFFGFLDQIGHRDFFANGGSRIQPGCSSLDVGCSHMRAVYYYEEAIRSRGSGFQTTLCDSYEQYNSGHCKNNYNITIYNDNFNAHISGKFYFQTNDSPPYGKYNKK